MVRLGVGLVFAVFVGLVVHESGRARGTGVDRPSSHDWAPTDADAIDSSTEDADMVRFRETAPSNEDEVNCCCFTGSTLSSTTAGSDGFVSVVDEQSSVAALDEGSS